MQLIRMDNQCGIHHTVRLFWVECRKTPSLRTWRMKGPEKVQRTNTSVSHDTVQTFLWPSHYTARSI